jgi:hypothetical protein
MCLPHWLQPQQKLLAPVLEVERFEVHRALHANAASPSTCCSLAACHALAAAERSHEDLQCTGAEHSALPCAHGHAWFV